MTAGLRPGSISRRIACISAPSFVCNGNSSVLLSGRALLQPPNQAFRPLHPKHLPLPSLLCLLISLPLRIILLPLTPGDGLFSSVRHIRPLPLLCSQKYDAHPTLHPDIFNNTALDQHHVLELAKHL
jgi:hypothetical protein